MIFDEWLVTPLNESVKRAPCLDSENWTQEEGGIFL